MARNKNNNHKSGATKKMWSGKRQSSQKRRDQYGQRDQGFRDENAETRSDRGNKNDVSWYTVYPELTIGAGSIPYTTKPGMSLPDWRNGTGNYMTPGVISMKWVPSIGRSAGPTDPASLIARELYSKVREKFSGTIVDAPDFAIYCVCLDSIFSYIAWLKRVYRTITAYTPQNMLYPDVLLYASGFHEADRLDLKKNRVKLWEHINELVSMTKRFKCPAQFPFITRHYWMNDRVFSDANTIMSQVYQFDQAYYYKFTLLNTPDNVPAGGADLVAPDLHSGVDSLFEFGKQLIEAFSAWDECYDINGYLMKAYEGEPSFEVDLLPQDDPLVTSYEPEVLSQIENIRTAGCVSPSPSDDPIPEGAISQDPKTNSVLSDPKVTVGGYGPAVLYNAESIPYWLNIHADSPTVADTIIASRLMPIYEQDTDTTKAKVTCGSEYVLRFDCAFGGGGSGGMTQLRLHSCGWLDGNVEGTLSGAEYLFNAASLFSAFDWHPQFWVHLRDIGIVGHWNYPVFDMYNVTPIDLKQLSEMHRVCLISEWKAYST